MATPINPFLYTEPDTGWTALHVAVTLNSETIVSQLLELGASNSVQDIEVRIAYNDCLVEYVFSGTFHSRHSELRTSL